ncbi:MAG: acyl carrier protein [Alphaproteobacteria bacterium]|nr:acyl carrier protein [Alphaproteobacteria bacterium]
MTLIDWLIARIAAQTGEAAVDADTPVYRYGVDSRMLALTIDDAERAHGLEADLDRISAGQTITALADALAPIPAATGD